MCNFVMSLFWSFSALLRSRNHMAFEVVALRRQITVLKRKNPRPKLSRWDRVFWVFLRRVWSGRTEVLEIAKMPLLLCNLEL
jgi:hypothetical protein